MPITADSIRVPSGAVEPLVRLGELDTVAQESLGEALNASLLSFGQVQLAVRQAVPTWSEAEIFDLVSYALSLSALASSNNIEPGRLAEAVSEQLPPEAGANVETVRTVLERMLGAAGLQGYAKALDVARESERLYDSARIVTDVRPIFPPDVSDDPTSAVVVHTLRIEYFSEARRRSIALALESSDLTQLMQTVMRAQAKARTVDRMLSRYGLTNFEITEADNG